MRKWLSCFSTCFLLVFLLPVSSCKYAEEYQTVNINNEFSVTLPSWLREEKDLKPGAPFQYANRFRNFYAIGESFRKSELTKTTGEIMHDNLNLLRTSMKDAQVTDSLNLTEGHIPGVRVELFGKMDEENIYFTEVLLEGKSKIYHVSIWTRNEERKLRFKEDITKIIHSVKEL